MNKKLLVGLSVAVSSLAIAIPASAKGGSGGGGGNGGGGNGGGNGGGGTTPTTVVTSVGSITQVSAAATCDGGTAISISLKKGFNKRVEATIVPTQQALNADGTPVGSSWWKQSLYNESTAKSIGAWGGNKTMSPGLVETILLSTVPTGTSELTYVATRQAIPAGSNIDIAVIEAGPVLETCTAHLVVFGK